MYLRCIDESCATKLESARARADVSALQRPAGSGGRPADVQPPGAEGAVVEPALLARSPRPQRGVAIPRVPSRVRAAGNRHHGRGQCAAGAGHQERRLGRALGHSLQAPGLESHRLLQGPGNDRGRHRGQVPGCAHRGLRFDRQHRRLDGRLCRARGNDGPRLSARRRRLAEQGGAGARLRRGDRRSGRQLRPGAGNGAARSPDRRFTSSTRSILSGSRARRR